MFRGPLVLFVYECSRCHGQSSIVLRLLRVTDASRRETDTPALVELECMGHHARPRGCDPLNLPPIALAYCPDLILTLDVCVDSQGQLNIRMPGERLSYLAGCLPLLTG